LIFSGVSNFKSKAVAVLSAFSFLKQIWHKKEGKANLINLPSSLLLEVFVPLDSPLVNSNTLKNFEVVNYVFHHFKKNTKYNDQYMLF